MISNQKYIDRLNATEEQKNEEANKLKNSEADIALRTAVLNIEKQIAELNRKIETGKSAFPYNPAQMYKDKSMLDLAERQLEFYEELRKEQF
jgi:hypothetical protein